MCLCDVLMAPLLRLDTYVSVQGAEQSRGANVQQTKAADVKTMPEAQWRFRPIHLQ